MTAMATHQMKKSIAELGVPEVPEFLQQIVDSGGHLWACRMSADMQHLEEDDLYDEVEAHHQRLRLHREDRRRPAALHLAIAFVKVDLGHTPQKQMDRPMRELTSSTSSRGWGSTRSIWAE